MKRTSDYVEGVRDGLIAGLVFTGLGAVIGLGIVAMVTW